ncbi:uncharacterized protein LOC143282794 [Babylonia areolata]|uniref:uncharacterized protein LOC143282794 n=1 Tax=Babylonia areolata TaxID=304850 RepID=UPI003FD5DE5C
MNQVFLRTDKGEYQPGETICGAVYLNIHTPTEAHGVQLSFSGRESVCCVQDTDGHNINLQASYDYVNYCNADLFTQKEPFSLGRYRFPFRLQIPYVTPGTFRASGSDPANTWSGSVMYRLHASILGAEAMLVEQEVVIRAVSTEALRENHMTRAHSLEVSSGSFFSRKVHITVKLHSNYIKSGDCARLKMVLTNQLNSRNCTFSIKLVRMLTLTIPHKPRSCVDGMGDHGEEASAGHTAQPFTKHVEGGPFVVRKVTGDLSHYSSVTFARGGALDNIMIPLKSMDGKCVMPSVHGKYIQCDYSLELSLQLGENNVQTVSCPILGVLPVDNDQWSSWTTLQWMHSADVKLSKSPGPITPPEQLLESEAFGCLPGFQNV